MTFKGLAAAAIATVVAAQGAAAATVVYTGSADGTDYMLTFDDTAGDRIDVTINTSGNNTDLLGLGFDFSGMLEFASFGFYSSSTGEGVTDLCMNTDTCGQGLNFNGTGATFDYIARLGDQGLFNGQYLENIAFFFETNLGLAALGDSFGIRAQSTGANGEGSIKMIDFEEVAPVPVPAAGLLLLTALGGLGLWRRRQSAA
jgi:hypothetical protein